MAVTVPGTFSTGTILATAQISSAVIDFMEAALVAFNAKSTGTPSWALYDDLSGASPDQDVVYRSIGDPGLGANGDRKIYHRFERTSATAFNTIAYLDWSTSSHTGLNAQTASWTIPTAATNITGHAWVNEHSAMFVFNQSSTWRVILIGHPNRVHVPRTHQGTAFSTGAVTAGSSVAIPVDEDLTNTLQVGLTVDVVPQAEGGAALPTFVPERCTVSAVSATHVTVSTLANNQPSGCAIGDDPCANYVINAANLSTANTFLFCLNRTLAATATATGQRTLSYTETDSDPDAAGTWHGMRLQLGGGSGTEWRGSAYHAGIWPTDGTQSPTRRFRNDFNDLDVWIQFNSIGAPSSYILCGRESSAGAGQVLFSRYGSDPVLDLGTITAGGTDKATELVQAIQTTLESFGWTTYDSLGAGGGFDERIIMRSTGFDDDARVYLGLSAAAAGASITWDLYLDWSTSSHTGRNVQTRTQSLASNTTIILWWICRNEYAATILWRQSGSSYSIFSVGEPYRTHIQASHRGRCFSTGAITAGSSVAIPVDRDMTTSLVVGGQVDIVPLAEDGAALPTFVPERVTISAISASTITVATLANNQPTHCLIGDDPCPSQISFNGPGGTVSIQNTGNFVLARAGSATATAPAVIESTLTEADVDPDVASIFRGTRIGFQGLTNNHRGTIQTHAIWATNGTPALEDTFRDYENGDFYRLFPAATSSSWILGMLQVFSSGAEFVGHLLEQIIDQREEPRSGPTISATYDDGVFHGFLSSFEPPGEDEPTSFDFAGETSMVVALNMDVTRSIAFAGDTSMAVNVIVCAEVVIGSVAAVDSTTVRVTFLAGVLDNGVLRRAEAYSISGSGHTPEVLEVIPEDVASPTYIDLRTAEMRDGVTYTLSVAVLEQAVPGSCNDPEISTVAALTSTSARVTFTEPMVNNTALTWPGAYRIVDGSRVRQVLSVLPEAVASPTYVDLITEEMRDGASLSLEIEILEYV